MTNLLYRLAGPTAFAPLPDAFSYSSLATIEHCPRQWQLAHARYGDLARFPARPHPAAVEGEIVHGMLDRLFKVSAVRGMPPVGTPLFREVLAEVDLQGSICKLIAENEAELAHHPRAGAFRLQASPPQLANRVIRFFRGLYEGAVLRHREIHLPNAVLPAPRQLPSGRALADLLRDRGALSELSLVHPGLPFRGIIDLVWSDQGTPVIIDFKTGQLQPEHTKQVAYYAVLWGRCSGTAPGRAEVRYPDRIVPVEFDEAFLITVEEELRNRIEAVNSSLSSVKARAITGERCRYCDVRQFCDEYWVARKPVPEKREPHQNSPLDIEITVADEPISGGFHALATNGKILPVVFQQELTSVFGPFAKDERLRVLASKIIEDGGLELKPWTEVFHLPH